MFRLFKWILVLACLAALAYVAFYVPLGDRTLYQHLVGISKTDEAKALKEGVSEKVRDVKDDVSSKLPVPKADGAPLSAPTEADRRALDELIKRDGQKPENR